MKLIYHVKAQYDTNKKFQELRAEAFTLGGDVLSYRKNRKDKAKVKCSKGYEKYLTHFRKWVGNIFRHVRSGYATKEFYEVAEFQEES